MRGYPYCADQWRELMSLQDGQSLVLVTLVFPESLANRFPRVAPLATDIRTPENGTVQIVPATGNALASISRDTALAFSVPDEQASAFLSRIQELPNGNEQSPESQSRAWVMRTAGGKDSSPRASIARSMRNAWSGFVDLIKVIESAHREVRWPR